MKSLAPSPHSWIGLRRILGVCGFAASRTPAARVALCAVLVAGALTGVARADDATHWLTPSRHANAKGLLFEDGIPTQERSSPPVGHAQLMREGAVLYGEHCSSCHGIDLKGTKGAPSLELAGGASVDFYLTTGRMPLADKARENRAERNPQGSTVALGTQAYHGPALFDARQTAALDAYVSAHARQRIPIVPVRLAGATLQRGRSLYEDNCEACHGVAAQGATVGYQWTALPLNRATPIELAEAVRIGPGVMPRFTRAELSDHDVDAIATYVRYLDENAQTYGGTVMDYLGPVSEGAVSAVIGVGFLFWVIYFTGTKANGRRFNETR